MNGGPYSLELGVGDVMRVYLLLSEDGIYYESIIKFIGYF